MALSLHCCSENTPAVKCGGLLLASKTCVNHDFETYFGQGYKAQPFAMQLKWGTGRMNQHADIGTQTTISFNGDLNDYL